MKYNNNRPRFLKLWQIRLPVAGIVSILHRVSGVILLLSFPFLLYLLQLSLSGAAGFSQAVEIIQSWPLSLLWLLLVWLSAHHLFAGVRVMLIDLDWGAGYTAARRSAWLVLGLAAAVMLIGGLR